MNSASRFLGLRTVVYYVPDMEAAREWYSSALGFEPYFDEPRFYIGYNVGGFELGLHPERNGERNDAVAGSVAYWGVENIEKEMVRLIELGGKQCRQAEDVGGGIKVGEIEDPFGNMIGLIENPHFLNTAAPGSVPHD